MSGPRDILNHGVHIGGRVVSSIPESPPTLATDGYPVATALASGISFIPPFILCMTEIEGGTNAKADIRAYGYFPEATSLLNQWQRIRTAVITGDITNYVVIPTIGAKRFSVIVSHAEGSPTSVRLYFRGISKEAADLIQTHEGEYRPIAGTGGKASLLPMSSVRIGPLTIDRAYQYFANQVCRVVSGDSSVVATLSDPPMQMGMVYEHKPRRASEQYIAFLAEAAAGNVWYGQFN